MSRQACYDPGLCMWLTSCNFRASRLPLHQFWLQGLTLHVHCSTLASVSSLVSVVQKHPCHALAISPPDCFTREARCSVFMLPELSMTHEYQQKSPQESASQGRVARDMLGTQPTGITSLTSHRGPRLSLACCRTPSLVIMENCTARVFRLRNHFRKSLRQCLTLRNDTEAPSHADRVQAASECKRLFVLVEGSIWTGNHLDVRALNWQGLGPGRLVCSPA
jgi:hypothetical protein